MCDSCDNALACATKCEWCENAKRLIREDGFYKCSCGGFACFNGENLGLDLPPHGKLLGAKCSDCGTSFHAYSKHEGDIAVGDRLIS